jgi:hypothetical protein
MTTPADGVAPLGKGIAIACEARLAVNVDMLTEFANYQVERTPSNLLREMGNGWR